MSPKKIIFQTLGWIGALLILAAYFLVSFEYVSPEDLSYQLMNIFGSAGIVLVAIGKRDFQPAVLNIAWILIAIFAILKSSDIIAVCL